MALQMLLTLATRIPEITQVQDRTSLNNRDSGSAVSVAATIPATPPSTTTTPQKVIRFIAQPKRVGAMFESLTTSATKRVATPSSQ
jgi:hypothetical protein